MIDCQSFDHVVDFAIVRGFASGQIRIKSDIRVKKMNAGVKSIVYALSLAYALGVSAEPLVRQNITLNYGWNAVYVEVAPPMTPDEVFADWPVNSVGLYDPASFLATRQFSDEWHSEGIAVSPIAMWRRDYPEVSQVLSIPAGMVCIAFSTNVTKTTVSLVGIPAAPRISWHITDTNNALNFVGFSLQKGASVTPSDYLEGFDGAVLKGGFFKLAGRHENKTPSITSVYSSTKVSDGDVLLVASSAQSNWSGVLNVSPMGGLSFGEDSVQQTLSVRNDGSTARKVAIEIFDGVEEKALALRRDWLYIRDGAVALTNAVWRQCAAGDSHLAEKRLAPGETWQFQVGLDRKAHAGLARGIPFGAVLRITDVDGASKMRVEVPITGLTSGDTGDGAVWSTGLWVAEVAFDAVQGPGDPAATETGGQLKVRLPIHVDQHGTVRMLQRVVAAGNVAADGIYSYRLYTDDAAIPSTASVVMRISAVCLPTEHPVLKGQGGFADKKLSFEFTVSGSGPTSLLRHPFHPQHDGLRWDFKTPAPSGDDFVNYSQEVKPETFSVKSRIELELDLDGGEATWNPENTKSGTVKWVLTGLRHEGAIAISGKMSIKRVAPKAELVLE